MVTGYRAIRKAEYGSVTVWLAQDDQNQLAYLLYPADTALATRVQTCRHLPEEQGRTVFEGVECSVLTVPNGISLEQLKATITEQGVFDVMVALVGALTALEEAGFPMPTGLIDERMLILDPSGTWRVDFVAAYLTMTDNQAAQLAEPEADVTRLCFGLLSNQRLAKSTKALQSLEWVCRARPPKSLRDWQTVLDKLQQQPSGMPMPRRLAIIGGVAMIALVVVMRLLSSGPDTREAPAAKPEPAPAVEPAVAETATPVAVAIPEETATAPNPTPAVREEISGPIHDVLPDFPRNGRPDGYKAEVQEPADEPTRALPPPPLPGPYCEASGVSTAGTTRYLQVDGKRVCTAHLLFWDKTYISFDAIAKVAYTDVGRIPEDEFIRVYGRTWILVRQSSLNRFGLSIEGFDGTTVYMSRL